MNHQTRGLGGDNVDYMDSYILKAIECHCNGANEQVIQRLAQAHVTIVTVILARIRTGLLQIVRVFMILHK